MINCIAIDDEPLALVIIEELCKNIPEVKLMRTFTKLSAAKMYLNEFPVDLIFLDIQMPNQNGVNFYRNLEDETLAIFTTAYPNYAIQGFEVNALDYLLKPIDPLRFEEACMRAQTVLNRKKKEKENHLSVRSEYALVKILFEKISHIETMDDYLKIHLENAKPVITLMSLKTMLAKLPENMFCRVHRSFIISLDKIDSMKDSKISLGSVQIPIGGRFRKDIINHLNADKVLKESLKE